MCRGRRISSNNAVLADPLEETKETYCIAKELEIKCDVPGLPNTITQKVVDGFVDPALEHSNKKVLDEKKKDIKVVGWQRMGIAKIVTMIDRLMVLRRRGKWRFIPWQCRSIVIFRVGMHTI